MEKFLKYIHNMNYIDKKKPQCGNYKEEFAAFIPSQFILKSNHNFKWLVG